MSERTDREERGAGRAASSLAVGMSDGGEGLRLSLGEVSRRPGEPPTVELRLRHEQEPPPEAEPFSPFRFPSEVTALLTGIDTNLLSALRAELTLRLRAGMTGLPLADGSPVLVEFAEAARALGSLEIGAEPDALGRAIPVVKAVDLHFEPAIVIHNVLHALSEVRQLFEDRTLGALLRTVPIQKALGRLQSLLPESLREIAERLGESDQLGVVHLERARARARWRRRTQSWELRIAFSGTLQLAGGVVRPFLDVELPNVLLPTPYAQLDRLLSNNPLASAALSADDRRLPPLLRGLLAAVEGAEGNVALEARLPRLAVESRFVDDTRLAVALALSEHMKAEGRFVAEVGAAASRVRLDGLRVGLPDEGLVLDADVRIQHDLEEGAKSWQERIGVSAALGLRKGSRVPEARVTLRRFHPLCKGELRAPLLLTDVGVTGTGALALEDGRFLLRPTTRRFAFHGGVRTTDDGRIDLPGASAHTTLEGGRFRGGLELDGAGTWRIRFDAGVRLLHAFQIAVPDIPEISVQAGFVSGVVRGRAEILGALELAFPRPNAPQLGFRGSALKLAVDLGRLQLGSRQLRLPAGSHVEIKARKGRLGVSGPEDVGLLLRWELEGETLLSDATGRAVSVIAPGLRRDSLEIELQPAGRIELRGAGGGLYGVNFFNALLNPAANPRHLLDVLRSEESMSHVLKALGVFAPDFAELFEDVRRAVLTLRAMGDRERILQPRDLIPRERLARFLSLLLVGTPALTERLIPIVRRVTEAGGLDVAGLKAILREQLDELHFDYEIDRVTRWLDLALSPTEPMAPPSAREMPPIAEEPRFAEERRALPTAAEIYERVAERKVTPGFANLLADLAPHLSVSQLAWIVRHRSARWGESAVSRLRYAHEVKRRVQRVADAYGGMQYAPQAPWIAFFLAEAADWTPEAPGPPRHAALGPVEVAVLLRSGLSTGRQSRQTQVNNRLLLQLMERRGPDFVLEVFTELGNQNPRALSSALMAFLDQDQDHLRAPVDLSAFLESHLGLAVPRRADYMAGGARARKSWSEALDRLAEAVLARSLPYRSRKEHLQVVRHAPRPLPPLGRGAHHALVEEARRAIAEADAYAGRCRFEDARGYRRRGTGEAEIEEARYGYGLACGACAKLLRAEPLAFRAPWFKAFWSRNEEALRVLSVVRNYQQDIDDVRYWLHIRRGLRAPVPPEKEQRLVDEVISAMYALPADQRALRADPLVRLLIDPVPGPWDLSLVSAMGVITEGAQGRELEDAYRRLWEQRGVRVLRAPTATGRSLEYNAGRIIEVIRTIEGPWAWVGYSQGCANGLKAESILRGGTPEQQQMLDRLVARNLLFSAANGAAHGSSGNRKLARLLVEGERFLKPYQALVSGPAIRAFHRVLRAGLESPFFVHAMGGTYSLTFERAVALHRDLQIREDVPTSTLRGVVEEPWVPEVLEYLYHILGALQPGAPHDTQVTLAETVGRAFGVTNDWTRTVAELDMGSRAQAIHHWSPLTAEIDFVRTDRDIARAIYESPKDRHVLPWLEVHARFGRL